MKKIVFMAIIICIANSKSFSQIKDTTFKISIDGNKKCFVDKSYKLLNLDSLVRKNENLFLLFNKPSKMNDTIKMLYKNFDNMPIAVAPNNVEYKILNAPTDKNGFLLPRKSK